LHNPISDSGKIPNTSTASPFKLISKRTSARGPAVGQPYLVFQDVQQLAAIYRLRGQSRFREIVDIVGHDRALNLAGGAPARG